MVKKRKARLCIFMSIGIWRLLSPAKSTSEVTGQETVKNKVFVGSKTVCMPMSDGALTKHFEGMASDHSCWYWVLFPKVQVLQQKPAAFQVSFAVLFPPFRPEEGWVFQEAIS